MEPQVFDRFFREQDLPPEVDVDAIRREWLALASPEGGSGRPFEIADRHLPRPVWARRPFDHTGREAWQILSRDVPALDPARPLCVYVHVPFCAERCHFCDCYSFRLGAHRERHANGYVDLLEQEIRLWSRLGALAARPVSTVHFGGGTPTTLGLGPFERLARLCRARFGTGPGTEWALESTASELAPGVLALLDALGFTRLHVGVQSLQDEVRRNLNRRATARDVVDTLAAAVGMGWIVSVDLIYGLPGQSLKGLVGDIRTLAAAGVDGFSLYELQISSRNRRFARQYGLERRDRWSNYFLSQVASRYLLSLGYEKTLFNHFAGEQDTNLYFTFPMRDEDLLALGTIADGVFADYHYRHPEYAAYGRGVGVDFPGLQGGLRRTALENRLQPLITALMAGAISPSLLDDRAQRPLLAGWRDGLLLADDPPSGDLRLTGNGSWFVGNMISQLVAAAERVQSEPSQTRPDPKIRPDPEIRPDRAALGGGGDGG